MADEPWRVRASAAAFDSDVGAFTEDSNLGDGLALQVAVERKVASWLGVELGLLYGDWGSDPAPFSVPSRQWTIEADVDFVAATAAVNAYFLTGDSVALYVGPLAAWIDYGDLDIIVDSPTGVVGDSSSKLKEKVAWGGQLGADIRLGDRRWSLHLVARYLDSSLELDGPSALPISFDPLSLGVGASWRF